MSVSLSPYGDALYGANYYGGTTPATSFRFDLPNDRANSFAAAAPSAAVFGVPQPARSAT